MKDILSYQGRVVRYTSNKSIEEGAQFYIGMVRGVEDDEIDINGMWHDIKSVVVLEEIFYEEGVTND